MVSYAVSNAVLVEIAEIVFKDLIGWVFNMPPSTIHYSSFAECVRTTFTFSLSLTRHYL